MDKNKIKLLLPYNQPFLFVDELITVNDNGVEGVYTFDKTSSFYQGHFKDFPVTPGVILTECCAQIGLVCLGIYLLGDAISKKNTIDLQIAMSSSEMEFYLPVLPGETVTVNSEKIYFRFNKLKCKVKLFNSDKKLVCKGTLAGMLKLNLDGK